MSSAPFARILGSDQREWEIKTERSLELGQSLYALHEAVKLPPGHPTIRRGIDFVRQTQLADGTWHVHRRAHPFQSPMESSFPLGADGWISATGTSWAVMALVLSLDPEQPPPPAAALAKTQAPASLATVAVAPVDFVSDIKPLFERSCLACHVGERAKGSFQMANRAALLQGGDRGEPVVIPGKPEESPLLRIVQDQEEVLEMPPLAKRSKFPALTKDEIAKLRTWIAAGAQWPEGVTLQPELTVY